MKTRISLGLKPTSLAKVQIAHLPKTSIQVDGMTMIIETELGEQVLSAILERASLVKDFRWVYCVNCRELK